MLPPGSCMASWIRIRIRIRSSRIRIQEKRGGFGFSWIRIRGAWIRIRIRDVRIRDVQIRTSLVHITVYNKQQTHSIMDILDFYLRANFGTFLPHYYSESRLEGRIQAVSFKDLRMTGTL